MNIIVLSHLHRCQTPSGTRSLLIGNPRCEGCGLIPCALYKIPRKTGNENPRGWQKSTATALSTSPLPLADMRTTGYSNQGQRDTKSLDQLLLKSVKRNGVGSRPVYGCIGIPTLSLIATNFEAMTRPGALKEPSQQVPLAISVARSRQVYTKWWWKHCLSIYPMRRVHLYMYVRPFLPPGACPAEPVPTGE